MGMTTGALCLPVWTFPLMCVVGYRMQVVYKALTCDMAMR